MNLQRALMPTQTQALMMGNTAMRYFAPASAKAAASASPVPLLDLQYMMHNARVKINLPN